MSVDTPPEPDRSPVLRREALLPNERSRGLGTVAVVCTMAGVASGLALATTLMAMQVADSMSVRTCPYRMGPVDVQTMELRSDHGFLGIRYVFRDGVAEVDSVLPGTPAEALSLRPGDHVISIDGAPIRAASDLQERIYGSHPGAQPSLVVERNGDYQTVRPTLAAWPVVSY
ncbi:MAG TPA: PDZ domain-containing protein [Kofleriaceae bacterium]|jgi:S1-C subfamily serine protease|nr:PDZ domain-containing protein [Kofleriaceae bacterium]